MMKIFSRLVFALNFARGRNAIFDKKYDLALTYLRRATASNDAVNSGLRGEAKIFTAICLFQQGNVKATINLYEDGLNEMREAGFYSMDDLRYVSQYMQALVHHTTVVEEPIDITNVRKSLRRDFPMSIETISNGSIH